MVLSTANTDWCFEFHKSCALFFNRECAPLFCGRPGRRCSTTQEARPPTPDEALPLITVLLLFTNLLLVLCYAAVSGRPNPPLFRRDLRADGKDELVGV